MSQAIGIIGLGVMGSNLALNIARNGFSVAAYDLESQKIKTLTGDQRAGKAIVGADSLQAFAAALQTPRLVLLMVPAGKPVDQVIGQVLPFLDPGDILVDGGNSHFKETERRSLALSEHDIDFIGMGISGGEEGALWGPSLMPGGQVAAWKRAAPIFQAIAARAADGQPCVAHIGPRGAGHYVKMVHNGIEYADMQLIAEIYDILSRGLGLSPAELHTVFEEWNAGELRSYLIEITANIFKKEDTETGLPLLDLILDEAKQKGTGKWASQDSLDIGAPIPTINAAVESRILSALKTERVTASQIIHGPVPAYNGDRQQLIDAARDALYASKIVSYAQGMGLLRTASHEYGYDLQLGEIARIWRAGCIIRASLLEDIMQAYHQDPALTNLLLADTFRNTVESRQDSWRFLVQTAIGMGIPVLALSSALAYFDAYRSARLPANLTQAQRDYFGAHTYRRLDREGTFHTEWI